ncbi:VOC family protein [Acidocella sp.]|uniref:VOC family protein n=1 Tax=Acidocella sp. TaxID=50710 RepID=UPI0026272934|nr:VOC family protein [Acidocella sp.]
MLNASADVQACLCVLCGGASAQTFVHAAPGNLPPNPPPIPRKPRYPGKRNDGSGFPPVHHIGMVVKNRDRTLAQLSDTMGFGPAFKFEGNFPNAILRNGEKGLALRVAFVWMRNTALEVVEPMDDRSPHHLFLKERGEGLHHLAYWVASVRTEIAAMSGCGAEPNLLVDGTGPGNDVPWCYLESEMPGSTIIELIERNPASEQFYVEVFKIIGGRIPV